MTVPEWSRSALTGIMLAGLWGQVWAQSIYTCVNAKGQRLTSDRPIAECVDREQKELNPSGTVKRRVGPSLTAQERAAEEEKARKAEEERARLAEDRRIERALLSRYPDKAAHDKERASALSQIDEVIKAANKRLGELAAQRKTIDAELEFYKKDPGKVPAALRRRIEEHEQSVAVQKRFIGDQDAEKTRVNRRFDEELVRLTALWAKGRTSPASVPSR